MKPIEDSIIKIKPYQEENLSDFIEAVRESEATVGQWLPWCHKKYTENEARLWFETCQRNLENQSAYDLGIFLQGTDQLIGSIAINRIDREHKMGNIGYWVRESYQNQGIASKAVHLIKEFGFKTLGLHRLEIVILEDNHPSRAVAEKSGAEFEWVAKNRLIHKQLAKPAVIYSFTS